MHNGPEFLKATVEYLKKPELSVLEKPFKVYYREGKVRFVGRHDHQLFTS